MTMTEIQTQITDIDHQAGARVRPVTEVDITEEDANQAGAPNRPTAKVPLVVLGAHLNLT